ncbi:sporulation integral membrane protein YtvI [Salsuginibacillus halophilus]|uniref:Sporulation integral membrane protein YtvI n=1 Tax=Salsuginibacillus halophilus TaxID=517424 RepID=A0A2P8HX56_9BACI|nr:sporulation integral membrane protein YtvI [Salsuginibacillus halophilus]PSL50821.1 sporulation integral membrane protein YtvI [Salsuginibacillus halophilus]
MSSFLTKRNIIALTTIIIAAVAAYFILPVSVPILLALFTALILSPVVRIMHERFKMKRNLAVMLTFTTFVLAFATAGYVIALQAVTQVIYFVENLPDYINQMNQALLSFQTNLEHTYADVPPDLIREINSQINESLIAMRDQFSEADVIATITAFVASIPNFLISFLVYLIALFLFMLELPRLRKQMYSFMKESTAEKVHFMSSRLAFVIAGFFKAQFLVSIIIFAVSYITLLFIAPELALIMSIIIWLIDFIPIIGSIAVLSPWALFEFIVNGDVFLGTQLLILAAVLLIIRRTVEPKVMGHHIGLSPLATLISLYIGLMLFGVIGFIAGPLLVIAFTSAREAGIIKLNFKV